MKNSTRITAIFLTLALAFSLCACSKMSGEMSSATDVVTQIEVTSKEDATSAPEDTSSNNTASKKPKPDDTSSKDITSKKPQSKPNNDTLSKDIVSKNPQSKPSSLVEDTSSKNVESESDSSENTESKKTESSVPNDKDTGNTSSIQSEEVSANKSETPEITLCAQVADDIYIMGGICSKNTEYIEISGAGVTPAKIKVAKGQNKNYFTTQVKVSFSTIVEIRGKETDKDLSNLVMRYVTTSSGKQNKMFQTDYKPVFGLDSQMHFYSSILSYTKSNILSSQEKEYVNQNVANTVAAAQAVGAEVIYLVIPSSAAVYPETLPSEFKAASGETLYKAFKSIAEKNGATVLYPLDTLKAHKNDGEGYKIYSHTDSHWTTYGAYWGVNTLMNHISGKHPTAKPRTVEEMGFYVTELFGGDALFSFNDNEGFENYSKAAATNGETRITGIKELTTLYKFKMPTNTLSEITRGKKSIYLTKDNETANVEKNPNGSGLPTAVVVRDSFGRTAYDMVNDRFSQVTWLAENDYIGAVDAINKSKPDYVVYIVSERNLLKVLHNNSNMRLTDRF